MNWPQKGPKGTKDSFFVFCAFLCGKSVLAFLSLRVLGGEKAGACVSR
jgi:hypothetical protein